jgi:hypothetical protein
VSAGSHGFGGWPALAGHDDGTREAAGGMASGARVPTQVVTGFLGAGKSTLIRHWLARRPPAERWAVLVNELGASRVDAGTGTAGVDVVEVAGGCACCAADVAFRTTLNRLLRRGPWDRLLVEVGASGHPARVVDRLLAMPGLAVLPSVAVVDGRRPAPFIDPGHPAHGQAVAQVELARQVLLRHAGAGMGEGLGGAVAALSSWPPQVVVLDESWDEPLGSPPADSPIDSSGEGHLEHWGWPPETVFDRRRLAQVLDSFEGEGGVLRAHGLLRMTGAFRTSRAWYRCDGGGHWAETAWRADNRLQTIANRRFNPQLVTEALESAIESRRFP